MSLVERATRLKRILSPSWWYFCLLIFTDPKLDYLNHYINKKSSINLTKPQPHYSINAFIWLQNNIQNLRGIIEWGAGNSTLWYQEQNLKVWSIEHNIRWVNKIRPHLKENVTLLFAQNKEDYTNPSVDFSNADLIVIDGIYRNECTESLLRNIYKGEVHKRFYILFDDAQRMEYAESIELLKKFCVDWKVFSGPIWVDLDHITFLFIIES